MIAVSSRTLYLAGWSVGLVGILLSFGDERFVALFVPAGGCIALAAIVNRPPGAVTRPSGGPSRNWSGQRLGLLVIGVAWAMVAVVVLAQRL